MTRSNTLTSSLLLLLFVVGLSACDKKKEDPTPQEVEPTTTTEPVSEEPAVEEPAVEEPAKDEPAAAGTVDEGKFINAYYEIACVQKEIVDAEKQKPIIDAILARYEFEQAAYEESVKTLSTKDNVKMAFTSRMEKCDKAIAEGFLTTGSAEVAAAEEEKEDKKDAVKKAAPTMPKFFGKKTTGSVSGSGITGGKVMMMIGKTGKVKGQFTGKKEGKVFVFPLSGSAGRDGKFRAMGSNGSNRATITGNATGSGVRGKISGTINKQAFVTSFSAK